MPFRNRAGATVLYEHPQLSSAASTAPTMLSKENALEGVLPVAPEAESAPCFSLRPDLDLVQLMHQIVILGIAWGIEGIIDTHSHAAFVSGSLWQDSGSHALGLPPHARNLRQFCKHLHNLATVCVFTTTT